MLETSPLVSVMEFVVLLSLLILIREERSDVTAAYEDVAEKQQGAGRKESGYTFQEKRRERDSVGLMAVLGGRPVDIV